MGIQVAQFLPVKGQNVSLDTFRMIQKKQVQCSFHWIQIHFSFVIGQMELATVWAGYYQIFVMHTDYLLILGKGLAGNRQFKVITSL